MGARRQLGQGGEVVLGVALLALVTLAVLVLFAIWPILDPLDAGSTEVATWGLFGQGPWTLSSGTALLVLVVVASSLGSFVHAATSFATYAGNRRLYHSWIWWYVLRTAIGASLALIVYFTIRGGLFTGNATTADINPYGVAAFAGLTGLFSKQATDKLEEVFAVALATKKGDGDDLREDKPISPHLLLDSINPEEVQAGSSDIAVVITGEGFMADLTARALREDRPDSAEQLDMEFESPTSVRVTVTEALLEVPGSVLISVFNPGPGGESDTIELSVTP